MNKRRQELPYVQPSGNTLQTRLRILAQPNSTFHRGKSRQRDQSSPYLDLRQKKKLTFYQERKRSQPKDYIIKQGRTIHFRQTIESQSNTSRAKSTGRQQALLVYRQDQQKQRNKSFMAYMSPTQKLSKQTKTFSKKLDNQTSQEPPQQLKQTKKNFRRGMFVQQPKIQLKQTNAWTDQDQSQMCLEEIWYSPQKKYDQQNLLKFKNISQQVDKTLTNKLNGYFNFSRPENKKTTYKLIRSTIQRTQSREVYIIEQRKVIDFMFGQQTGKVLRHQQKNPVVEPSDSDSLQ